MEINIIGMFDESEELYEVMKIAKVFVVEERIQAITDYKPLVTKHEEEKIKQPTHQKARKIFSVRGLN